MGSTTIFHPSNDEILCVPRSIDPHRDHTHSASASTAASGVPSSSSAASSASSLPNPSSAKALSRARPRQEPQPPSAGTAKSAPPSHSRNHRLSLATIAHDKTSTALANLSARPPPAASSLRTSPSSGNLSDNRSTSNPQFASPRTNRILNGEKTSETQTNPFAAGTDSSSSSSSRSDIAHSSTGGSAPSEAEYPLYYTVQPSSRAAAFTPCYSPQGSFNKMHQTSSRLLRMTDEERPFTRVSRRFHLRLTGRLRQYSVFGSFLLGDDSCGSANLKAKSRTAEDTPIPHISQVPKHRCISWISDWFCDGRKLVGYVFLVAERQDNLFLYIAT